MSQLWKAPYKWIFKGDDKEHLFQLKDKAGNNYDLTNVNEITFTVNEEDEEGASQVFQCTMTGSDVVRIAPYTDGKMKVVVVPADTNSTTAGRKIYDIEVEDQNNKTKTFGKGIYEVVQDAS